MFKIYGDLSSFWQWDTGQKLIVNDSACQEVHFDNGTTDCALVCAVYEQDGTRFVNVPNILLQSAATLYAYAFLEDDDGERTKCSKCFKVYPRPKPADYVYTETEVWTAEKAVAEALEEAKASGAFKGEKGDKGDKGDPGEPGGGQSYVLPIATPDNLGGVQPIAKTEDMTQSVGVDEVGGLWTVPGGGSGGGITFTTLWSGTAAHDTSITLADDYRNYDYLIAVAGISGSRQYQFTGVFQTADMLNKNYDQLYLSTPFEAKDGSITHYCGMVLERYSPTAFKVGSKFYGWESASLFRLVGVKING